MLYAGDPNNPATRSEPCGRCNGTGKLDGARRLIGRWRATTSKEDAHAGWGEALGRLEGVFIHLESLAAGGNRTAAEALEYFAELGWYAPITKEDAA